MKSVMKSKNSRKISKKTSRKTIRKTSMKTSRKTMKSKKMNMRGGVNLFSKKKPSKSKNNAMKQYENKERQIAELRQQLNAKKKSKSNVNSKYS